MDFGKRKNHFLTKQDYIASKRLEKKAPIAFLLMPGGLSIPVLKKLAIHPKQGTGKAFGYLCPKFLQAHKPIEKPHIIVITKDNLKESYLLPHVEKLKLTSKPGCELEVLAVATLKLFWFNYIDVVRKPGHYTLCIGNARVGIDVRGSLFIDDPSTSKGPGGGGDFSMFVQEELQGVGAMKRLETSLDEE